MKKIKVYTRSLGCPKNLVDTEKILGGLSSACEPVSDILSSNLVLINTCAFIQPAVEESLDVIFSTHETAAQMEHPPLLAVTGCLVSRYGSELISELPEVDIFSDISSQGKLPELILKHFKIPQPVAEPERIISTPPSYAYLKISEGCNNRCSFCCIPSIRGKLRSQHADRIILQAERLIRSGVKELVLVAQDSTAYGRDLGSGINLLTILGELASLKDLQWLRVMYLYPSGLSQSLLEFMAETGSPILPYFDVPFQHSHPEILKKMGRPFREDPTEIIRKIRNILPQAVIRSTLITGYPGETREHFRHLYDFVKRTRLNHLGVFPYYAEEGTRAAGYPEQVPEHIKASRASTLMKVQKKISTELLLPYENQNIEVLVDSPHPEWPGLYSGRAWFQAPDVDGITYVSGPDVIPGRIVQARVQETRDYDLVALQE